MHVGFLPGKNDLTNREYNQKQTLCSGICTIPDRVLDLRRVTELADVASAHDCGSLNFQQQGLMCQLHGRSTMSYWQQGLKPKLHRRFALIVCVTAGVWLTPDTGLCLTAYPVLVATAEQHGDEYPAPDHQQDSCL